MTISFTHAGKSLSASSICGTYEILPRVSIFPESNFINPAIARVSVLFPEPFAPVININSPESAFNEILFIAVLSPYLIITLSSLILSVI